MKSVSVDKAKLVETLKTNRDEHRANFEEALEGWAKAVVAEIDRLREDALAKRKINQYISHTRPEDHTDDYDRVIAMLEWSNEGEVVLTEQEFAHYVQDNWGWSEGWTISNSAYSASLAQKAAQWS